MSPIRPTTTVRELLSHHPQAFSVLVRFGMCPECRADPPPVPLSHFAMKHCDGKLDVLLEALYAVISPSDRDVEPGGSEPDPA